MEVFLPFRSFNRDREVTPVTEVRSTLIVSALQILRTHGLYDEYLAALSPEARQRIESLVPGEWLSISLGLEHYQAMQGLHLDARIIESIGGEVADRINRSFLSVAINVSKRVGATPWTALSMAHRLNDFNWRGGDVRVCRSSAKEALYEWIGQPCASVPYFVTSFTGYARAIAGLFCEKAHARPVHERCTSNSIVCRLTWI